MLREVYLNCKLTLNLQLIFHERPIAAAVYFFPCLYLFRFSTKRQTALANNEQAILSKSFGVLKSFYKFIGILTIVGLSLFAFEIIFVILAAAFFAR